MRRSNVQPFGGVSALVLGASLVGSGAAHAQPAVSSKGDRQIEEVIVTARRVSERLQSVPLTVTAISGAQLRANVIQSGLDLQKLVPTLSVIQGSSASAASYSVRGIRDGVITYLDEVPTLNTQAGAAAVDLQLFDLASVQAISGPQGTLFGRNSTGGAILFVPQKPTNRFEGFVSGEYGNYNRRQFTTAINIPVSDVLQIRLDGQIIRRDGVVKNLQGPSEQDVNRSAVRVGILFTPTSNVKNYTLVDYGTFGGHPFAPITFHYVGGPCPTPYPACVYGDLPVTLQALQNQLGPRTLTSHYPDTQNDKEFGVENVLTYSFSDDYSLKYVTGIRTTDSHLFNSQVSFDLPLIVGQAQNSSEEYIQELQLHGLSLADRFSWVAGLYWQRVISHNDNGFQILQPVGAPPFSLADAQRSPVEQNDQSEAAYLQGTYKLTAQLSLTGGVRLTEDDEKSILGSFGPGNVCDLPSTADNVDAATCQQFESKTFRAATYLGSINYQYTHDILFYATTGSGYNAGGFNQGLAGAGSSSYAPEHLTNYEVGIKADWHLGSVPIRSNISGFYGKYTNIQREIVKIVGGTAFAGTFNAARATIYGTQLDMVARPFSFLDLSGNVGYLHTRYDSFLASALQANATGNKFAQAPEWTINVSGAFHHDLRFAQAFANISYAYLSKVTFTDTNIGSPNAFQPGYGLVDLSLGFRNIGGRPLEISVYGKNLTNTLYAVNISDQSSSLGYTSYFYGDPRTYGVRAQYNF